MNMCTITPSRLRPLVRGALFLCVGASFVAGLALTISDAHAQSDNDVVCPAIYPCKADGTVLEPFRNNSVCGLRFQAQCLGDKLNRVAKDLVSCSQSSDTLSKRIRGLRRQVRNLQNKVGKGSRSK